MRNCFSALLICFLPGMFLLTPVAVQSQQSSVLDFARAGNGVIEVLVERSSGQFRIEAAGGAPLLFRGKKGVTAYSNLHALNNTWTTNKLHRPAVPLGTLALPNLLIEELIDRVRLSATVKKGQDSVRFVQDLIPSVEGDYAYINIVTSIENLSQEAISVGTMLMLDIMIGEADTVDLSVESMRITHERDWRAAAVPAEYQAAAAGSPYRIRGRLRSATADTPDRFVAGNWQFNGYLGTTVWDYDPSGLSITDDAVLLRWDDQILAPGENRIVRTDYGYTTFTDLSLICEIDDIGYNNDSSGYAPDPVAFRAIVRNTGVLPLSALDLLSPGASI